MAGGIGARKRFTSTEPKMMLREKKPNGCTCVSLVSGHIFNFPGLGLINSITDNPDNNAHTLIKPPGVRKWDALSHQSVRLDGHA